MDLEFSRVDYTLLGLTYPGTAKLLPSQGPKTPQKVAVADRDGVLQVFGVKKGEIHLVFKTLPGPPVSCLQLGGALGTVQDKIFISSGNEVRGYTKKGKLFLSFDTNLTEPIKSMYVSGSNLLVCGDHAYNQYFDCKDVNSYLCGDRIVDIIALGAEKGNNKLLVVLACEDRILRILDRHDLLHSVELESAPSVLFTYPGSDDQILYGTVDGRIGVITATRNEVNHRWILKKSTNRSCVTCMDCYDLTASGIPNLVVGHQDGSVEVYSFADDGDDSDATLRYAYTCNESIMSVQCGVLGSAGYDEIVVTTYTVGMASFAAVTSLGPVAARAGVPQYQCCFGNGIPHHHCYCYRSRLPICLRCTAGSHLKSSHRVEAAMAVFKLHHHSPLLSRAIYIIANIVAWRR